MPVTPHRAKTDALVASLPSAVTFSLRTREDPIFTETGAEIVFKGYSLSIRPEIPLSDLNLALSKIDEALAPLDETACLRLLIEVRALTRSRSEDDDLKLQLQLMRQRLREYPGDMVAYLLNDWPRRSEFWPTWKELEDYLEQPRLRRTELKAILLRYIAKIYPPSA